MSWENWIKTNKLQEDINYDDLLEQLHERFIHKERTKKMDEKDKVHHIISWWFKNKNRFKRYKTLASIGKIFNLHHATLLHYCKTRKKSRLYDIATEELKKHIRI